MTKDGLAPLGHAYIIASPDAAVREDAAARLSAAMVCRGENKPCMECPECRRALDGIHPDVTFIDRLKDDSGKPYKDLKVKQIRAMTLDAWIRPTQADRKVYIIREAGKMNTQAQNAALKILEEPPRHAAFILCVDNARVLLPTIRSRCVTLFPCGGEAPAENSEALEYLKLAGEGNALKLCEFFIGCESMNAEQLGEFVDSVKRLLADVICRRSGGIEIEKAKRLMDAFEKAGEYLRANVGVKHICGMLCAQSE